MATHRYEVRFIHREVPSREEGREGSSTYPILHSSSHFPARSRSSSVPPSLSSPRSNSISSRFSFFFLLSLFFSTVAINVSTFQRHRDEITSASNQTPDAFRYIIATTVLLGETVYTRRVDQKFSLQATREIKQMQHTNLFCSLPYSLRLLLILHERLIFLPLSLLDTKFFIT